MYTNSYWKCHSLLKGIHFPYKLQVFPYKFQNFLVQVIAFADAFKGCGKNSADDVDSVYIKNTQSHDQEICVDGLKLK